MTYAATLQTLLDAIVQGDAPEACGFLRDEGKLDAGARLEIYRHAYRARLEGAVADAYPATRHCLGMEAFSSLVRAFVSATPSLHFNLDLYPIRFASYAAQARADGFACALAQVESAIHEVYHAEETPALTPEFLARCTPQALGEARLAPRAASRLLALSYPVDDTLAAFRAGELPPRPGSANEFLLVVRHDRAVRRLKLAPAEHALLTRLAHGDTLQQALDALSETVEAGELTNWCARWVREGCLKEPV